MADISATDAVLPRAGTDTPTMRDDLKMLAYWISLGAAAGGLGGGLVGGIGGRLAMFLLRLTSDASVRGLESDDGFIIGRFNVGDTSNLLIGTAFMGALTGLIMMAGRPFLPERGMAFAWTVAGAVTGGALFIHTDGVDFTLLEPHWLALALFIALPAAGAFLIAWLVERYSRFWWRDRRATAAASVAALPAVFLAPLVVVAVLWLLALRVEGTRNLARWMPARVAAVAVFAAIVGLGAVALLGDARAIL